ncbi:MAG TPA: outer membrane beta-barrel domain-containing protein [Steroidobacteraceae bacterium]
MARRLHVFLLSAVALTGYAAPAAHAQGQTDAVGGSTQTPQVVEPQVERRTVDPAKLPTENFEAGVFVGTIGIEDFGSSLVYGGRVAYHFTEDLFAEAVVGQAKAGRTSYEDLSGAAQLLTDSERKFTYYDISAGWNVLPGEVFLPRKYAMPAAIYVSLGIGNTRFAGDDHFTVALGSGLRLVVNKWLALHLDARDHMFQSDLLGKNKLTQNLQFTLGATAFF